MSQPKREGNWWGQAASWDHYGRRLVGHEAAITSLLRHFSDFALKQSGVVAGDAILDVGCGCGDTTIELARRAGPNARVLGVDISETMLVNARAAAKAARLENVAFERVNVEHQSPGLQAYDFMFSRFGVMFFDDPVKAFTEIRSRLSAAGRVAFVCWDGLVHNTWIDLHLETIAPFMDSDMGPRGDELTGPFSFSNPVRTRGILEAAGFANIKVRRYTPAVPLFGIADLDAFVDFSFTQLHAWLAMKERTSPLTDELRAALRAAYEPYSTERGVVMQSAVWIVTADNRRSS